MRRSRARSAALFVRQIRPSLRKPTTDPARQHIVDRSGDRGRGREARALLAQPRFQRRYKRGALFLAHPQTLFGALAVDAAFDIEQGVDALLLRRPASHTLDRFFLCGLGRLDFGGGGWAALFMSAAASSDMTSKPLRRSAYVLGPVSIKKTVLAARATALLHS